MRNTRYEIRSRRGAALLVVLFIVMAITILSLGFLSRSDVELACGENMILRTQMDYLAESAMEHAKGLILNPQDVAGEYWTGQVSQQLVAGSSDYYNVTVKRHDSGSGPAYTYRCNYDVNSTAYRLKNGEEVGRSSLTAELRLDPAIGFWADDDTTISGSTTINGDLYCDGNLINEGTIRGDVFASGSITNSMMSGGTITGSSNENVSSDPVDWPGLAISDFSSQYYIGSTAYSVQEIADGNYSDVSWGPSAGNPAGIYYHNGDLELEQNVIINGTLVVDGKLLISGTGNAISAVKNFPAIIIGVHLDIEGSAGITVEGLIQSEGEVHIKKGANNAIINIIGGLFIKVNGFNVDSSSFTMTITAAPARASLETWPTAGNPARWTPAGGAFFKSIERE